VRHDQKGFVLDSRAVVDIPDRPAVRQDGSSLSGKERDHLFLSHFPKERQFTDVSGISGLDNPSDGRAFATLDFDHDGWLDVAMASANRPLLSLYQNRIGRAADETLARAGNRIALRFEGGNRANATSDKWSNRSGYGALVSLEVGARRIVRELRCGEGFASQNSATLLIGIGAAERVDRITVRWPSGLVQETLDVPHGTLLIVRENPVVAPGGEPFERAPYPSAVGGPGATAAANGTGASLQLASLAGREPTDLTMYTTMATHCQTCRSEMPELQHLRDAFGADVLGMYGVPVDETEGREDLLKFAETTSAPYELLVDLDAGERTRVKDYAAAALGDEGTPATIVTDAKGRVLLTRWGAPNVSELKRLLNGAAAAPAE
jgi:peroxiredoxin